MQTAPQPLGFEGEKHATMASEGVEVNERCKNRLLRKGVYFEVEAIQKEGQARRDYLSMPSNSDTGKSKPTCSGLVHMLFSRFFFCTQYFTYLLVPAEGGMKD